MEDSDEWSNDDECTIQLLLDTGMSREKAEEVVSYVNRKKKTMPKGESVNVMTQKLNPLTGEYGWQVQDESYDYHQEIARSSFADMLHDYERNEKYYAAIKSAVEQIHREGKQAHVLDIGTGTGLLAMMAARCGADTIHACEAFSPISECAVRVIADNGLADRITVVHKRSTDMVLGEDLPRRCNLLVSEVFDTELIGEGAIATFNHAHAHLMEKPCLVVPTRGTVYAQVVESDWMQRWNRLARWRDVAPSAAIQRCPGAAAVHDLQLSQLRPEHFRALTDPEPVFRFDWSNSGSTDSAIPVEDSSVVSTKAVASGTAQMVFMWWSLDMDPQGEIVLSCAPWWAHPSCPSGPDNIPWRDHWMQAVYYLESQAQVSEGQTLKLLSSHDEFSLWFGLNTDESSSKQLKRPVCDCMLHATCSRTRIGMLNDPSRREKYHAALRRLVTPDSVVLSLGDNSMLGLLAASLGASKVYHVEENCHSYDVMSELIKDNNLGSKVSLLASHNLSNEIKSSVTLVVGEPYLTTALFPWHIHRWWSLKQQLCPAAAAMPSSASLYVMPMQFDHLHKIRAPLGTISGFKMTTFDNLIMGSSSISDNEVEVHPLWEYPGICLGEPKEIKTIVGIEEFVSMGNMPFNVSGTWHGMAMWVDIHLDSDTTVSTGPVEPPIPGHRVRWDPYTRQAVYFLIPEVPVTETNLLQYKAVFDQNTMDDIKFTFNLQNNNPKLVPDKKR